MWNHHAIAIHGEHQHNPKDMFFFRMLQHGMHGIDVAQFPDKLDNIDDIQGYGVDWEAFDEDNIREHHDLS